MPSCNHHSKAGRTMRMSNPSVKHIYTFPELCKEVEILRHTFHIIRLVSPENCLTYYIKDNKLTTDALCYSFWNRKCCCKYCISRQVLDSQGQCTKLESMDGHIFIVIAKYISLEGKIFTMEMITEFTDISGLAAMNMFCLKYGVCRKKIPALSGILLQDVTVAIIWIPILKTICWKRNSSIRNFALL